MVDECVRDFYWLVMSRPLLSNSEIFKHRHPRERIETSSMIGNDSTYITDYLNPLLSSIKYIIVSYISNSTNAMP
jgi:hypothetical protein